MTISLRLALAAATAAVLLWTVKSLTIGIAGGIDKSPAEGPLFLSGLAAFVTAAAALGVALTRGRPTWVRVVGGILGPVIGFAVSMAVDGIVGMFHAEGQVRHWVWTEFNLWVGGLLALAVVLRVVAAERR